MYATSGFAPLVVPLEDEADSAKAFVNDEEDDEEDEEDEEDEDEEDEDEEDEEEEDKEEAEEPSENTASAAPEGTPAGGRYWPVSAESGPPGGK